MRSWKNPQGLNPFSAPSNAINPGSHGWQPARQSNGHSPSDPMSAQDIIIAVMGITGAGKTTFISRCMGEDVGIGHGLHSQTQDVAIHSFSRNGRIIRLIDTQGFDDTSKSDVHILNNIAFWLSHAYRAEPKLLLSGVIYLHPVSDTRMSGSATKNVQMMKLLCGEQNLSVIWLASTMWDHVSPEMGARREQELKSTENFWGGLLRNGSTVCRHQDSAASAFAIIDNIIARRQKVTLNIQRQMVDERKDVDQTDAGKYLRKTVHQEQQKVHDRLVRSAEEFEEKLASNEAAAVEELLERQRGYQRQLEEKDRSLEAMRTDMEKLRENKAREFEQRQQQFEKDKQVQDAKTAELDRQLQDLEQARIAAIQKADEAAASRKELEDNQLQLMLQRDQAIIAGIDSAIAERKRAEEVAEQQRKRIEEAIEDRRRQEEEIAKERQQMEKKKSVFRKTLKVSMAESIVHGGLHLAGHALAAACVVM